MKTTKIQGALDFLDFLNFLGILDILDFLHFVFCLVVRSTSFH